MTTLIEFNDRINEHGGGGLTVAIDFDGTFAADPDTWAKVVRVLQGGGHLVVLITNRPDTFDWGDAVFETIAAAFHLDDEWHCFWAPEVRRENLQAELGFRVLLAGINTKREFAAKRGYRVDIWIDDRPQDIDNGAWG